jgi:heme exporter protein C
VRRYAGFFLNANDVSTMNPPTSHAAPFRTPGRINWLGYASPQAFYPVAGRLIPWCAGAAVALAAAGLAIGFLLAPTDRQQGDAYRIIFVHVPAAWLSMLIYVAMAFWAGLGLVLNTRLSAMMARALAPTGALFTFLALWTGALWGRPTWGAWWVWDARLTSELLLLFLYVGFMALQSAIDDPVRGDKAGAVIALVGVINVPVIYFSVQWWNTLHQGASVSLRAAPSMAATMLTGMLVMTLALWAYAIAAALARLRCIILERERGAAWVHALGARR